MDPSTVPFYVLKSTCHDKLLLTFYETKEKYFGLIKNMAISISKLFLV